MVRCRLNWLYKYKAGARSDNKTMNYGFNTLNPGIHEAACLLLRLGIAGSWSDEINSGRFAICLPEKEPHCD